MNERRERATSIERAKAWLLQCLALLAFGTMALGLASCGGGGGEPVTDENVTYQQCQWGVGCLPQCTIKYGPSPYCDRN